MTGFDDLEDDLPVATPAPTPKVYVEKCSKCRGSGLWLAPTSLGHQRCTQCEGTGKKVFKSSPEDRLKAREAARRNKAKRIEERAEFNLRKFTENHPKVAAWFADSTFPFAISLRDAVKKFGNLSDKQLDAAYKCVDKMQQFVQNRELLKAEAKEVNVSVIQEVFTTALTKGYKKPSLRLGDFRFSPAPATGRNAGAIYVKKDGEYMGKVADGKFYRVATCDKETETQIVEAAATPKDTAIAYGRRTGCCAVCGRQLDNKESVERGIGPICAEKFGW